MDLCVEGVTPYSFTRRSTCYRYIHRYIHVRVTGPPPPPTPTYVYIYIYIYIYICTYVIFCNMHVCKCPVLSPLQRSFGFSGAWDVDEIQGAGFRA